MKVLVIAPHADDEVIGCGGAIAKYVAEGHEVHVVLCVLGSVNRRTNQVKATAERRQGEFEAAMEFLGVSSRRILFEGVENKLDSLPLLDIIARLDAVLDEGYDHVLFACPSHHQDHRVIVDACFAALREGARRNGPSLIAMYEYAYNSWYPMLIPAGKYYVDITDHIETKKAALALYESQLYPPPHPISIHAIESLARTRGVECGRPYAELLYLVKMMG